MIYLEGRVLPNVQYEYIRWLHLRRNWQAGKAMDREMSFFGEKKFLKTGENPGGGEKKFFFIYSIFSPFEIRDITKMVMARKICFFLCSTRPWLKYEYALGNQIPSIIDQIRPSNSVSKLEQWVFGSLSPATGGMYGMRNNSAVGRFGWIQIIRQSPQQNI